ncbi:MAG TPA: YebC/PmpR family DNA-binding transcriptional regulator [Thermoanaerobaculia bacterium]|nr:YebC/PmpR family DNA-binding transcriptional regulator [Thermoanaerobaculia bacterium]
MSGHSKWATIKHKKAVTDARRGKAFTKLLKEITVATRMGGADPKGNPRLRSAILDARGSSVPNDTIDRAVKKGSGDLGGATFEELVYEGYGPGGSAILVEAATDNRNRTAGEIRHIFTKNGGNLAEAGAVSWMFDRRGYFAIDRESQGEDAFMELGLELGADDISTDGEAYEIFTSVEDFLRVQEELAQRKIVTLVGELSMIPQTYMELASDRVRSAMRLMEALEDHDDVQKVWGNFEVAPEALDS